MAFNRKKSGLSIDGVGSRARRSHGAPRFGGMGQSPHSYKRAANASQRAALSRAAKGRGTYIHPSGYGKRGIQLSRRSVITFVIVASIAVALAVCVGFLVYQQAAKNAYKPVLDEGSLSKVLSPVASDLEPSWSVLVHTDSTSAEEGRGSISDLALICRNPDNVTLTILWIPTNTRVYIDGYGYGRIEEAFANQAGAGITAAVEKLAGVSASHYFEINNAGLDRLENQLAPLSVDASSASRDALVCALCKKLFGSSSEQISSRVEVFANYVATDASLDDIKKAFRSIHGINIDTSCYIEEMPATVQAIDGVEYSVCNTDQWNTMVSRVESGMSPVASAEEVDTNKVTRENCTVSVWNGVGVSGVANDCASELKKLGWNVIFTGNANQFIYDETFVVFKDTDDEAAARLLAADLGQGRVVRSYARYSYTGNLLVVVGKDYKPY